MRCRGGGDGGRCQIFVGSFIYSLVVSLSIAFVYFYFHFNIVILFEGVDT